MSAALSWLCDMDGVLISDGAMVPGADNFLDRLRATNRPFLMLTNNSLFTPRELRDMLARWDSTSSKSSCGPRRWRRPSSSTTSGRRAAPS